MNCRSYTGKVLDIYDSDHKLVALQARLPSKRQRRNIFKSLAPNPKPNLKLLRDDAKKRKEFSKAIFEELDRHPLRDSDDANAIEQLISDALNAAAMYVCPPAENEDPVWYTSDFKAKIEEMLAEKEPKKPQKVDSRNAEAPAEAEKSPLQSSRAKNQPGCRKSKDRGGISPSARIENGQEQ